MQVTNLFNRFKSLFRQKNPLVKSSVKFVSSGYRGSFGALNTMLYPVNENKHFPEDRLKLRQQRFDESLRYDPSELMEGEGNVVSIKKGELTRV